jgi:very-short-patch-repair endonuclease
MDSLVRPKRFGGLKFRRQQPIGTYIVDFVCFEQKIIVELDGGQHGLPEEMNHDSEVPRSRAAGHLIL